MTLHTSAQCAISGGNGAYLAPTTQNCDANVDGNVGCAFHSTDGNSYGTGFNNNGGGTYAMEWNSGGISIWWWPRNVARPGDALSTNPNPANWGAPASKWVGTGCNWDGHFNNHNLIFDTTFCGDWAGAVFGNCAGNGQSCNDFVRTNPGAFQNAYWQLNSLKVYQNNGAASKAKAPAKKKPAKKPNKAAILAKPVSSQSEESTDPTSVNTATANDTTVPTEVQPSPSEDGTPLPHGPTPALAPPEAGLGLVNGTVNESSASNTKRDTSSGPVQARRRRHLHDHAHNANKH